MSSESGRAKFLAYLLQGVRGFSESPQRLFAQDEALRRNFCAVYFFADTREQQDVGVWVRQELPRLLRQLSRTTERERVVYQGEIHGKVDWPTTYKVRYQTEHNPGLFVCRPPQRRENTPENQLLKFLLVEMERDLKSLSPLILTAERWTANGPAEAGWLQQRLHLLTHDLKLALANVHLRSVEVPAMITPYHLLKAQTSKTELYSRVAHFYGRYQQLVTQAEWEAIYPIFSHTLLLPDPVSPLGDQCIRLAALGFREAEIAKEEKV